MLVSVSCKVNSATKGKFTWILNSRMFFDVSDIQMQTMGLLNTQSVYSTLDTIYEHMGLFGVTLTLLSYSAKYTHITQKQNNISFILAPTNINI